MKLISEQDVQVWQDVKMGLSLWFRECTCHDAKHRFQVYGALLLQTVRYWAALNGVLFFLMGGMMLAGAIWTPEQLVSDQYDFIAWGESARIAMASFMTRMSVVITLVVVVMNRVIHYSNIAQRSREHTEVERRAEHD